MAVATTVPNKVYGGVKGAVLIVDDNADFADSLADILSLDGYDVRTAGDAEAAIAACAERVPELALVDIRLGTSDGVALVGDLMARHPHLLCIMVTAYAATDTAIGAMRRGAYDYLRKPVNHDELLAVLARAFDRIRLAEANRRAEMALRESEERYRTLVALSPVGLYRTDLAGNCFYVNERWQRITGRSLGEALERGWVEAIHPEDRERVLAEWSQFCEKGKPFFLEYRYLAPNGATRWVLGQTATEQGPNGQPIGLVGTVTDITDRRRAEEAERQMQRMEALVRMSGGVAHEFNNLLAVLVGNLELAQDDEDLGDATRKVIDRAIGAADRGADLVAQLQSFSRREPQSPGPVDAMAVAAETAQLVAPILGPSITLDVEPGEGIWPVHSDAAHLEGALINLINNARDALPQGGRIRIAAHNLEINRRSAVTSADLAPGAYVVIEVTDNGTGMSSAVAQRAFDPFFTTKTVGEGTGLGLSAVYGFATEGGGTARIESASGEGTTVRLYLRRSWQRPPARVTSAQEPVEAGRGERILVFDDDPGLRRLAVELLNSLGYEALEASTAKEARDRLLETPAFDLLLANLRLTARAGASVPIREARARQPQLAVLYMSGQASGSSSDETQDDGDGPVLKKPFRRAELARHVRQALAGRRQTHQPE